MKAETTVVFGGGWDSVVAALLVPGSDIYHEIWSTDANRLGLKRKSKSIPLFDDQLAHRWRNLGYVYKGVLFY